MKVTKLNCPHCGGVVSSDVCGRSSVFCNYCGQTIYLDDGSTTHTINKNININKTIHKRTTDDADVIRAQNEGKDSKIYFIMMAMLLVFSFVPMLIWGIIPSCKAESAKNDGKIVAYGYNDLVGQDYQSVKATLEAAGFTNIDLIDLNDSGLFFWDDGKVKMISIAGDTDFGEFDYFDPADKVIITYH